MCGVNHPRKIPFFLFLEASKIVNADGVKRNLPSLFVSEKSCGSRKNKQAEMLT